jgi:arylsulfatase
MIKKLAAGAALITLSTLGAGATVTTPVPQSSSISAPATPSRARPNILVIIFDDNGISDFGAYGSEIHTPNIDALAKSGLRYNHFDTKAICSSTRASFLTGRNNQTVRMADLPSRKLKEDPTDDSKDKGDLPRNAETLAQALQAVGYDTYAVGKWHLSPAYDGGPGGPRDPGGGKPSWPLQRGFQHYYGFLGGWTDQYKPVLIRDNTPILAPETPGYHLSVDLADHAIADIDASKADGKPAFVYLALGASHTPIQAPRSYIDHYRGVYEKGWDAIRRERFERARKLGVIPADTRLPPRAAGDAAWDSLDPLHKKVFAQFMATFAGFLEHADAQIGRVIQHLKDTGQYDNTMIVLFSDNGGASEGGPNGGFRHPYNDRMSVEDMAAHLDELGGPTTEALYQRPWGLASSAPFRRYKLWPYAGGRRDPLIISWPCGIHGGGGIRPQPVDVIDLAPTILDVAGTRFDSNFGGAKQIPVAGRSVRASFASSTAVAGRPVQFFELRGNRAIRDGKWEAIAVHKWGTPFTSDRWQLFDLSKDFSESNDLSRSNPAKLEELKRIWWREARRYSNPPIEEMSSALHKFEPFDIE